MMSFLKLIFIFVVCVGVCICTNSVYGANSVVTTRTQYGGDTTIPSTPTLLSAIPVAQTQIDVSWGASTDDFLLGGYKVFRDTVQIATTTLTTYSDFGLTPNTVYTYFIKAFDDSLNVSSSSGSVSTTTLPSVATSTPTTTPVSSSGGSLTSMELRSLTLIPSLTAVHVQWETSLYSRFELHWGRSSSYELGFVANDVYKKINATVIDGLESGTTYEYELIAYDQQNHQTVLKRSQFKTLSAPDTMAPANVSNLHATIDGNAVLLSWDNPPESDFSHVRIVRSPLFYPNDQQDGFIAYIGKNNSYYDTRALQNQPIQYYTVFSYDMQGNISSGAIITVRLESFVEPQTSSSPDTASSSLSDNLDFEAIEFIQNNVLIDTQMIDAFSPLTVRIPYEKLPEHLKTVMLSFTHPTDSTATFSFLLRINKDKTYYEAVIAPLRIKGLYPVSLIVYDYHIQKLSVVEGVVRVVAVATDQEKVRGEESKVKMVTTLLMISATSGSLLVLWFLFFLFRRMKRG